jgi:hypothetical protein
VEDIIKDDNVTNNDEQNTSLPEEEKVTTNHQVVHVIRYELGIWTIKAYKTPHSCSRCALDHQFEQAYFFHGKDKLAEINYHLRIPNVGVKDILRGHLRHYYYQHCTIPHEDEYCTSPRNNKNANTTTTTTTDYNTNQEDETALITTTTSELS